MNILHMLGRPYTQTKITLINLILLILKINFFILFLSRKNILNGLNLLLCLPNWSGTTRSPGLIYTESGFVNHQTSGSRSRFTKHHGTCIAAESA